MNDEYDPIDEPGPPDLVPTCGLVAMGADTAG